MTASFKDLLAAKASEIQQRRTDAPAPAAKPNPYTKAKLAPTTPEQEIDRVEINVSANRLDLYFNRVPSQETRDSLKFCSWRYNPTNKTWYNKDCEQNRKYIRKTFNVYLEAYPEQVATATPAPTPALQIVPKPEPKPEPLTSDDNVFLQYKRQVDELIDVLKVDPVQLLFIAVDKLHNETFKN